LAEPGDAGDAFSRSVTGTPISAQFFIVAHTLLSKSCAIAVQHAMNLSHFRT